MNIEQQIQNEQAIGSRTVYHHSHYSYFKTKCCDAIVNRQSSSSIQALEDRMPKNGLDQNGYCCFSVGFTLLKWKEMEKI